MNENDPQPIAVVGLGAILPDAPDVASFWENLREGRYSISDVDPRRWDPELYYDPDPAAPDKTYSRIGGWVRDFAWDPLAWHLPVPPRVAAQMDQGQQWAVSCARAALLDYGWPERPLDTERTAVILGNSLAGDKHYQTTIRIQLPELIRGLERTPRFGSLPAETREAVITETLDGLRAAYPEITEDTMPGELANIIAGRVANLFNLRGPSFTADAACASALAATAAAVEGLRAHRFDAVITGGVDRNMGIGAFVKFCKVGALSATGSRPYGEGADGFVMGEGAALLLLKRLTDAERDGDRVYAVIRAIAGASDGRGKGITAPNPVGQRLAVERAWAEVDLSPATATLMEGHGTSTRVGDVVEVQSMAEVLQAAGAGPGRVALGSVKSNIGHLKSAAGAAGMLKTVLALHHRVLPPTLHARTPNPDIDFATTPLRVNHELVDWCDTGPEGVRRAGVSAFGFGGTNFHAVLEEYIPGRFDGDGHGQAAVPIRSPISSTAAARGDADQSPIAPTPPSHLATSSEVAKAPLRGALVIGGGTVEDLMRRLTAVEAEARAGSAPPPAPPCESDLHAPERVALDYASAADLADNASAARRALEMEAGAAAQPVWKALRARGTAHRGSGPAPKVAFLYTGQGSQYANMLATLRQRDPIVAATFAEADRIMAPLLGGRLSERIFVDAGDERAMAGAEAALRETEITQPAVITADVALTRLLAAYGITPDMAMGHSLGEYGALLAAGSLTFEQALEAVSARGREMSQLSVPDRGLMAAVFAPMAEIEEAVQDVDGCIIANLNSTGQAVIGGGSEAVRRVMERLEGAGRTVVELPVSHAFHTGIVAPASVPLRAALVRLGLRAPRLPIVSNVTGDLYPSGAGAGEEALDLLARQVASPVQFVTGLRTLHREGARVYLEVGPKKALQGFAEDVLGSLPGVVTLFTNHPKSGDVVSFNQALCGLYAAGLGTGVPASPIRVNPSAADGDLTEKASAMPNPTPVSDDYYQRIGRLVDDLVAREHGTRPAGPGASLPAAPVVITGAALGLPGHERVFADTHVAGILNGEQCIDTLPMRFRQAMIDKRITRLVKRESGDPSFETITEAEGVIRLAGRAGKLDLVAEYGLDSQRVEAYDITTQLAVAAGLDALRDAGIPLVLRYRTTSLGSRLPDRYLLPDEMRDDTGVIFASAFPGGDTLVRTVTEYERDSARRHMLAELGSLRERLVESGGGEAALAEIDRRIHAVATALESQAFTFDRRFIFRVLAMGHSQFAELIGARGPNTQVNAACASTTQAVALAEDWIHAGRCRRVVVIAADDVTSDALMEWVGSGLLATGAAATDDAVENAALPFDRRRHGMLIGMGAAGIVVEDAAAARERGLAPICEVVSSVVANSAFHGTRLDVGHIAATMEALVRRAESVLGIGRAELASDLVFVSHETYTPARGGSASAEVEALRAVFGAAADRVLVANTKGFTGHPMGVGIEDIVAVKALETGIVPPVPNFQEVDPELGELRLSKGGAYQVRYALRLGAGFGSQISMTLLRWVPPPDGARHAPDQLGYAYRVADRLAWSGWLSRVAGRPDAELEVVRRTLRIREERPPAEVEPGLAARAEGAPAETPAATARPGEASPAAPPPAAPQSPAAAPPPAAAPSPAAAPPPAAAPSATGDGAFPAASAVATAVATPAMAAAPSPAAAAAVLAPAVHPGGTIPGPDEVRARVLALVAEKTGYPEEMLDLDLDLEADLGVDTVKQAELFSVIRESYAIPRDDTLRLRDLPTLAHVIDFVVQRLGSGPGNAAPASAAALPEAEEVRARVLSLVAEKTGYPEEMLDVDLDLEADLGVDTVKQAELFSVIRESYAIPRDDTLRLRDLPTLAHVIDFVVQRVAAPVAREAETAERETPEPAPEASAARPAPIDLAVAGRVAARVPVALPRPPLALFKGTGVTVEAASRIVIAVDEGGVGAALRRRLEASGVSLLTLDPAAAPADTATRLAGFLSAGPVQGLFWLPALDVEADIAALDVGGWREGLRRRVKAFHALIRELPGLGAPGTFLVAATRLGGRHGYDERGAGAAMGGAVTGYTKALARERPEMLVKAVDHGLDAAPEEVAEHLVAEVLADPSVVEVGYAAGSRWAVGLTAREDPGSEPGLRLGPESVFVITGAAGGIVAAITADLAAACGGGTFHLLDLIPEPEPHNPDLERVGTDREGLKRDLVNRLREQGERVTPAVVERSLARLERQAAARDAVRAVTAAGGTARYHRVDLTDAPRVAEVVAEIRAENGRVDALLHAAGIEVSRMAPDKDDSEFARVFDVKADGFFSLLRALGSTPLDVCLVFSSVAGRFGNAGQTDYAAANDLLCKLSSGLARSRPETRFLAIDWTAWGGIGMATRGSVPLMMERAGIETLTPSVGIATVRRELCAAGSRGEVVVAGALGVLVEERTPRGGVREDLPATGPMLTRLVDCGGDGAAVVEITLDPARQPFLADHRIDGIPVLPGVMAMEAMAEAARVVLPEWRVAAMEDVDFLAPFKLYRDQRRAASVEVRLEQGTAGSALAHCRLVGRRVLTGRSEPRITLHATATLRLARGPGTARTRSASAPSAVPGTAVTSGEIYRVYFHGPAYRVLEEAWAEDGTVMGRMAGSLPDDLPSGAGRAVLMPRAAELCFQTAGVRQLGRTGVLGLPAHVDAVEWPAAPVDAGQPLLARVHAPAEGGGGGVDAEVTDAAGTELLRMRGYRTVALPSALPAELIDPFARALG